MKTAKMPIDESIPLKYLLSLVFLVFVDVAASRIYYLKKISTNYSSSPVQPSDSGTRKRTEFLLAIEPVLPLSVKDVEEIVGIGFSLTKNRCFLYLDQEWNQNSYFSSVGTQFNLNNTVLRHFLQYATRFCKFTAYLK